ncbi:MULTISPECIES: hypothetical protein [Kitasatospora]|uniref:Uncharacterized protein n=1 Tax=Kitasatospora setae (strain ATCC 33774 / DSM 43861 / JCM 3304 / KCC A-0304 / NBRC 14216 / KM-6054) TaxID=452652 RepID=E4N450_KITSK|nr:MULTISPECIES: hypothetical protein [Kitasatospora]BAJ25981.1 hypothetical protein KSE_01300 [Kitasatospora setae KM-6054]
MGVHGVAAAGAREARFDPLLADRVVDALLLVGLPVAHGGHGPGVHLFASGSAEDTGSTYGLDPERWPLTLRWLCSPRLEDAAAAGGTDSPWPRTRRLVADSIETALAELLPALGLSATRDAPDGPTRIGPADSPTTPAAPAAPELAVEPAVELPAVELPAAAVAAVRRAAALAGLPLAAHPRAVGVALTACLPAPDTAPVADVAWRPSPRLPDGPPVSTAVRESMHHAVGSVLAGCGLRTTWHRPPDSAPHLHAAAR